MTVDFNAAVLEELHGIRVALTALVASKPALYPNETLQELHSAEFKIQKPRLTAAEAALLTEVEKVQATLRDAEVAQAAKTFKAEKVIKPEERQLDEKSFNALITDGVDRNILSVAQIKSVLKKYEKAKLGELQPEQYDAFLKEFGL